MWILNIALTSNNEQSECIYQNLKQSEFQNATCYIGVWTFSPIYNLVIERENWNDIQYICFQQSEEIGEKIIMKCRTIH